MEPLPACSATDMPTNANFLHSVEFLCNASFDDLVQAPTEDAYDPAELLALFESMMVSVQEEEPSSNASSHHGPAAAQTMEGALFLPPTIDGDQLPLFGAWDPVHVQPLCLPSDGAIAIVDPGLADLQPPSLSSDPEAGGTEVWCKYAQKRVRDGAHALAVLKQSYRCQRAGCCAVKITEKNTTRDGPHALVDLVFHGMHNHQISITLRQEMENATHYDPTYTGGRIQRRPRGCNRRPRSAPYAMRSRM